MLAQHSLAALHHAAGDKGAAFAWYEKAVELGHAPAQFCVVAMYGEGMGHA